MVGNYADLFLLRINHTKLNLDINFILIRDFGYQHIFIRIRSIEFKKLCVKVNGLNIHTYLATFDLLVIFCASNL